MQHKHTDKRDIQTDTQIQIDTNKYNVTIDKTRKTDGYAQIQKPRQTSKDTTKYRNTFRQPGRQKTDTRTVTERQTLRAGPHGCDRADRC